MEEKEEGAMGAEDFLNTLEPWSKLPTKRDFVIDSAYLQSDSRASREGEASYIPPDL